MLSAACGEKKALGRFKENEADMEPAEVLPFWRVSCVFVY